MVITEKKLQTQSEGTGNNKDIFLEIFSTTELEECMNESVEVH